MISMGKNYVLRDGTPVRVLCVDASGRQSVLALWQNGAVVRYYPDGKFKESGYEHPYDLVIAKQPVEDRIALLLRPGNMTYCNVHSVADLVGILHEARDEIIKLRAGR